MTRLSLIQTNFTAGEISPELLGRGDLAAYQNGAARLANVLVLPTGGVTRRPGTLHIDTARGEGRLVGFEFNTAQTYLIAFSDGWIDIYFEDQKFFSLESPWNAEMLPELRWTQSADTLLLCQPEVSPRSLRRNADGSFSLVEWEWQETDGALNIPFNRFAASEITLTPSGTTGSITLTASADVFESGHVGCRFRVAGKQLLIGDILSPTQAAATVKQTLAGTGATKDWDEQAFSPVRGYPVAPAFHQDRLVLGGSRDLPNRLWLSKSSDLFNFDLGEGLDDEAIEFPILSDQVNAIRAVFSGRHLQVMTSGAEWMVTGDPLTPGNIQLKRQTRIGSRSDRYIPPCDVDGATLFVSRSGREIREFLYTDVEQAYQSNDLTMLARHMVEEPLDQVYDRSRRALFLPLGTGRVAVATLYRSEQVSAWMTFETQGAVKSASLVGETLYFLIEREGSYRIERLDDGLSVDAAVLGSSEDRPDIWEGFGHLEGKVVDVVADGIYRGKFTVAQGELKLDRPAGAIMAGLGFRHVIEPLPVFLPQGPGVGQGAPCRMVRATFRLHKHSRLPSIPAMEPCRFPSKERALRVCWIPPSMLLAGIGQYGPWGGRRPVGRPGAFRRIRPFLRPSCPSLPNMQLHLHEAGKQKIKIRR